MTKILAFFMALSLSGCIGGGNGVNGPKNLPGSVSTPQGDLSTVIEVSNLQIDSLDTLPSALPSFTANPTGQLPTQEVVLKNSSGTSFDLSNLTVNGLGYVIKLSRCGLSLPSGSVCSLIVEFSARGLTDGTYSGELKLSNSGSAQLTSTVSGQPNLDITGNPNLKLSLSSSFIPMGDYGARDLTILNIGTGTVTGLAFTPPVGYIIRINHCPTNLRPNQACSMQIFFPAWRSQPPGNDLFNVVGINLPVVAIRMGLVGNPCSALGQTVADGSTLSSYANSSVAFGGTCAPVVSTCSNGTFDNAPLSNISCSVSGAVNCSALGQSVPSSSSITTYSASIVPFGSTCTPVVSTCSNGTFNTPAQSSLTCAVASALNCSANGQAVNSGSSVVTYPTPSVAFGNTCAPTTSVCTNGSFDTAPKSNLSCSVNAALSCSANGSTVTSGSSLTSFSSSTVPFGSTCAPVVSTCTNGSFSPAVQSSPSCSVAAALNCSANGQSAISGTSITTYSSPTVAFGSTCTPIVSSCSNGVFSLTPAVNSTCSALSPLTCSFNGQTIAHGSAVTSYSASTVPNGSTCATVAISSTCNNGAFSVTPGLASCSVLPAQPFTSNSFQRATVGTLTPTTVTGTGLGITASLNLGSSANSSTAVTSSMGSLGAGSAAIGSYYSLQSLDVTKTNLTTNTSYNYLASQVINFYATDSFISCTLLSTCTNSINLIGTYTSPAILNGVYRYSAQLSGTDFQGFGAVNSINVRVNSVSYPIPVVNNEINRFANINAPTVSDVASAIDTPYSVNFGDSLYVNLSNQIYKISPDQSLTKITNINSAGSAFGELVAGPDGIYFVGSSADGTKKSLTRYSPTSGQITSLSKINSSGDKISKIVIFNNKVYFGALNASGYNKLFKYDPISNLITQVSNTSGSATVSDGLLDTMVATSTNLYFGAVQTSGFDKLVKMSTSESITVLSDIATMTHNSSYPDYVSPDDNSYPHYVTLGNDHVRVAGFFNGELYFTAWHAYVTSITTYTLYNTQINTSNVTDGTASTLYKLKSDGTIVSVPTEAYPSWIRVIDTQFINNRMYLTVTSSLNDSYLTNGQEYLSNVFVVDSSGAIRHTAASVFNYPSKIFDGDIYYTQQTLMAQDSAGNQILATAAGAAGGKTLLKFNPNFEVAWAIDNSRPYEANKQAIPLGSVGNYFYFLSAASATTITTGTGSSTVYTENLAQKIFRLEKK